MLQEKVESCGQIAGCKTVEEKLLVRILAEWRLGWWDIIWEMVEGEDPD